VGLLSVSRMTVSRMTSPAGKHSASAHDFARIPWLAFGCRAIGRVWMRVLQVLVRPLAGHAPKVRFGSTLGPLTPLKLPPWTSVPAREWARWRPKETFFWPHGPAGACLIVLVLRLGGPLATALLFLGPAGEIRRRLSQRDLFCHPFAAHWWRHLTASVAMSACAPLGR